MWHSKQEVAQHAPMLLFGCSPTASPNVRQSAGESRQTCQMFWIQFAAFGLGLYADRLASTLNSENFTAIAMILRRVIQDSNSREAANIMATENAISSLGRYALCCSELQCTDCVLRVIKGLMESKQMEPVPALFKEWLSYLPLTVEELEMVPVYKNLCYIWYPSFWCLLKSLTWMKWVWSRVTERWGVLEEGGGSLY